MIILSFTRLRGPSQSILMDFSGHVMRLYVVGIMTTVSHSSPIRFSSINFLSCFDGSKRNKIERENERAGGENKSKKISTAYQAVIRSENTTVTL